MITLSELYFMNSDWDSDIDITVALDGEFYCIQGKELPYCDFHNCIVSAFSSTLVIVKRR